MSKNPYQSDDIQLLRLSTAGSVDDGKSTLIGRLLHDCQAIYEDQFQAVQKASKKKGNGEIDLALLLDGLSAEREQGITIDVAYRYFSTPKRKFIIADSPGHEQYTRNMVTGASTANLALILVDARKGILTQSKRHLFIASLLGIPHILIAINKMDLVDYKEDKFEEIKKDFLKFSEKLDIKDLQFTPISALKGDMVVNRQENLTWYDGPTILSYLENVQTISDKNLIDFRFPIQYVMRPNQDFRGYAGKIASGTIKKGEPVMIIPSGVETKIKSLYWDEKEVDEVATPMSAIITLEDEIDASRGDMIVRTNNLPIASNDFEAMVCWFDTTSMKKDHRYILKQTTNSTSAFVTKLNYRININTLHREKEADTLELNEIGRLSIHTQHPIFFDTYKKNKQTGSFILIDEATNNTIAAGVIIDKGKKTSFIHGDKELTSQKGAALWLTGLSGSGKSTIANHLYKRLKERGLECEQLDGDVMREHLCQGLGFSKEDRDINLDRASFVAGLLSKHGILTLASFISPYESQRAKLRKNIPNFIEVFINTPLKICEERDVKGLYKKARAGEIKSFTGISDPYEAPENPELEIKTPETSIDKAVEIIINYLLDNGYLGNTNRMR
ncbi:sulfate adenylyltransferase subunit CysN [Candidatus Peregrinibacteria bacterium]|jgi:bifunctional enzyme CysN/CysC|nr:sulfate adenylyltransferase subunit CysN [Candidatus Peregrinibacteria bacterium]MBT7703588.1 sulfate adenylyltransferase subunit CysN [Candidatus Peregrinibacteria bacterium]